MGRSRGVKVDLVGAVYMMEERENEREGVRGQETKQDRGDSKRCVYTSLTDPMAFAVRASVCQVPLAPLQ